MFISEFQYQNFLKLGSQATNLTLVSGRDCNFIYSLCSLLHLQLCHLSVSFASLVSQLLLALVMGLMITLLCSHRKLDMQSPDCRLSKSAGSVSSNTVATDKQGYGHCIVTMFLLM